MHRETGDAGGHAGWYLAYTEPRRETTAKDHLDRQGYETYLPLFGRIEPMFPRYLFFRPARASQSIAPVRSTRGVQTVVRFGAQYAQVPSDLIRAIQQHEALRRQQASAGLPLRPGQRVRVQLNAPAFAGLEGLVHSSAARRVVVLMEFLGQQTPVKLRAEHVEVI